MEELEEVHRQHGADALTQFLIPIETSVQSLSAVKLSSSAQFYLRTGQSVMVPHILVNGMVRLYSQAGHFLGVGEMLDDGRVAPRRLISQLDNMAKAV
jgi:tRNA pseudouridine55 synthase